MAVHLVLAATLLAMGPQWVIIDLPYPEGTETQSSGAASAHAEALQAARSYGRARKPTPRKVEVTELRVDGAKASATLDFGDRTELVQLVHRDGEWRVLAPSAR